MMALKPDMLNGQHIFRGVESDGGVNFTNRTIVFPPSIKVGPVSLDQLVVTEAKAIIVLKALTSDELAQRLYDFSQAVLLNEERRKAIG